MPSASRSRRRRRTYDLRARLRSWIRASARRDDLEHRMQDEMLAHVEMYETELRQRGFSEEEAWRRARAEFGSLEARKTSAGNRSAFGCSTSFVGTRVCRAAAPPIAGVHRSGTGVARSWRGREHGDLQPDRDHHAEVASGDGASAPLLCRQFGRTIGWLEWSTLPLLRTAPGPQPIPRRHRRSTRPASKSPLTA